VRNAPKLVPAAHHIWCASGPGFGHFSRPMPGVAWAAEVEQCLKAGPVVISLLASLRLP